MIEPLSDSSKTLLDTIKQCTILLSLILSALSIYILARYLHNATSLYRNLLIAITVQSVLTDLLLQEFLDPVFMFPLPCMYFQGSLARWTRVSPVLGFEIWVSFISSVMLFYGFCVMYRNQIILPPNHPFRIPKKLKVVLSVFFSTSIITQGQIFKFAAERSDGTIDAHFTRLSSSWPSDIRNRTNCIHPPRMYFVIAEYTLSIIFCLAFAFGVCAHTFYTLSRLQMMSEKTRACHRRLTKSLILQVAIPILTILLPESGLVLRFFVDIESPEFAPIVIKCLGMHSIAHSLTVILSSKEFRRRIFGKKTNRKVTVSKMSLG